MKTDENLFWKNAEMGKQHFIENIKLLLFKDNSDVFDLIDFEDDNIYQEPLLYAQFNFQDTSNLTIENILYGYMKKEARPKKMSVKSDAFGRIYLANYGWIITSVENQNFELLTKDNDEIDLLIDGNTIDFTLEPLSRVEKEGPEIVKYPIPVLNECYVRHDDMTVEFDVERITRRKETDLVKAWDLVKELFPEQYDLIKMMTKKMVIFNVTDGSEANSFATRNAQGMAFYHSYQEEYNEVFFLDDIAHQTGHVIFYAVTAETEKFIKLPPRSFLSEFEGGKGQGGRTVYVLFHAFYTYYTTLKFLDKALRKKCFEGEREHEAKGRILFYIEKYRKDLTFLNKYIGADKLFTEEGKVIFDKISNDMAEVIDYWYPKVKHLDTSDQPYNFTYSKFLELNPISELQGKSE